MMRQKYPRLGVGSPCGLFGKTQNASYDHLRRATAPALPDGLLLELVAGFRNQMPRLGRDYRLALLAAHGQRRPGT